MERAVNNNQFKTIQKINANDGSSVYNYSTVDYNLFENGKYYYRLKMIDKDGTFTYSDIKTLSINVANTGITIYPNPIIKGGKVQILWPNTNGKIGYKIMQIDGKLIAENSIQFYAGVANLSLKNNLPSGSYVIQFFKNGEMDRVKIIVE